MLDGLRGEDSIAELCRREGINQNLYYRWSKEFLGAGKKRLAGDTAREATSEEVKDLRRQSAHDYLGENQMMAFSEVQVQGQPLASESRSTLERVPFSPLIPRGPSRPGRPVQ